MNEPSGVSEAREVLTGAVAHGVFPAAVADVGDSRSSQWAQAFGALTFDAGAQPTTLDSIFDLASLTKPLATTSLALDLIASGELMLATSIGDRVRDWRGTDRRAVTIADLLEHASGLPARLLDAPPEGRREFEHDIAATPLEYEPRSRAVYSDLGFILLGFIVEDCAQDTLDSIFRRLTERIAASDADDGPLELGFTVPAPRRANTAPTQPLDEDRRRGRRLIAEVHDNYAAALSGVAGHAGLFGTAAAIGRFARALLAAMRRERDGSGALSPEIIRRSVTRSTVPGSSRALGWDTMLPSSSCGTRMSAAAFGHVGYTGTSLWIDPQRNRYFVLLTNRAYAGGSLDDMRTVRRSFHDAFGEL
jgi:CubicO group peptidase (beta-lactamase class C family)